ncbi:hypothetical protein [Natranaerofaba carboxydovora]|uniref:hypothetical protein n=1 Tax=Natranaerofaba carboxydovora TaxID=2742683 RepID=UPI001F12B8D4|nr:hypothetical protein [Natranaerofaba carboxydovora]UMZ74948.1 hypothetical protein ACONDI_02554 [Natranaerofaba carboxydovora]
MDYKKALLTLLPHESKRLIAKGVKKILEDRNVLENNKVLISLGTTNIYVLEEITGAPLKEREKFIAGMITEGVQCINAKENRLTPVLIDKNGQAAHVMDMFETIKEFGKDDVFIKGANAVDNENNIGIYMANEDTGGTISVYPFLAARGINMINPVGMEKLIPSVPLVADKVGTRELDYNIGKKCGMICIPSSTVVSEIEAFGVLTGVNAYHVSSGGVEGSEGACGFLLEGERNQVEKSISLIKEIKKEPSLEVKKISCSDCDSPCYLIKDL